MQSILAPGVVDVSNAGRATSKGIEVEGALSAGRGLQLAGSLSWLDAVYGRYNAVERSLGTLNAAGNRLGNAPAWSGSGSALYEVPTTRAGRVVVRGDASWQSRVYFSPSNTAVQSQPAYGLVHLRTAFEPRGGRWEAAVYARNLTRQPYLTATWDATGDAAISGRPGEPRHWGVQFTMHR